MGGAPVTAPAAERWRSGVFQFLHRNNLVYVTSFEDPAVDRCALEVGPSDRVVTITSGGCNALDLVLAGALEVHAVDVNPLQTALLELRIAAIRKLGHDDFFALFGRGWSPHWRELYHDTLQSALPDAARAFWDGHMHWFSGCGWRQRFVYQGSAGLIHKLLRDYAFKTCALGPAIDDLLCATTVEQQREVYARHEVRRRFGTRLFRWFVSRPLALSLLGIPWQQRREIEAYHTDGMAGYALDALERALTQTPLRENYFWRGVLEGGYTPKCCPEFLKEGEFSRLKAGLIDRLFAHTSTLTDFLGSTREPVHKLSLLDHMDWMSSFDPAALTAEWSAILARCPHGARVVFRSAAREVRYLDSIYAELDGRKIRLEDAIRPHPQLSRDLYARERTGIYGSFHVIDLRHGH